MWKFGVLTWSLLIAWLNKYKYLCLRKVQCWVFHINQLRLHIRNQHSSTKCVWSYFHLSMQVLVTCKRPRWPSQVVWLAMLKLYYPKRSQSEIHINPSRLGIHVVCQQHLPWVPVMKCEKSSRKFSMEKKLSRYILLTMKEQIVTTKNGQPCWVMT